MQENGARRPRRVRRAVSRRRRIPARVPGWLTTAALLAGIAVGVPARAASVTVQALAQDTGAPLAAAAVCLGTPADPTQFGVRRTGPRGVAVFAQVPAVGLLLTVSKPNFRGERRTLPRASGDRAYNVLLRHGGTGPRCQAPPAAPAAAGLHLLGLAIDGGAAVTHRREVRLDLRVSGGATQYRASESPDFAGASWRPFRARPRFELSPAPGRKRVYVQVRRQLANRGASVESRSRVAVATIELAP